MSAGTGTWRLIGWVAVLVLTVLGVVQWWAGTPPLALLVASYVAVLGLLTRALPVRVAVSAAFLAVMAAYLLLLTLAPLAVDGPLRPGAALAILLAPVLALAVDPFLGRGAVARGWRLPPAALWGSLAGGAAMVTAVLLASRSGPFGAVAWTASGDSRNHLLISRGVLEDGGLGGEWLSSPVFHEALVALLLGTHGRGTLDPGELLRHDLVGYAHASTALAVAWSVAAVAPLLGLGRLRARGGAGVVLVASLLPLTGLALGVTIRDGFLPLLLLQPVLLCALGVLMWLATADDTGRPVTVGVAATAVALPVVALTWTPLFPVLAVACALPWLRSLRSGRQRLARLAAMLVGGLSGSAACLAALLDREGTVALTGSIAAPSPAAAALAPLAVLVIAITGASGAGGRPFVPVLAGSVAAFGIVAWAVAGQPPDLPWNYYPSKLAWIWAVAVLPVLLAPFAHPPVSAERPARRGPALVGATGVLLAAVALSSVASPVPPKDLAWTQIGNAPAATIGDWYYPVPATLALAVELGDRNRRYVVFRVEPAEDRMANFWLVPYDDLADRELFYWAYADQGRPEDICALLEQQPDRIVVTADEAAEPELEATCGREVRVRLVPAPGS